MKYEQPIMNVELLYMKDIITTSPSDELEDWIGGGDTIDPNNY